MQPFKNCWRLLTKKQTSNIENMSRKKKKMVRTLTKRRTSKGKCGTDGEWELANL